MTVVTQNYELIPYHTPNGIIIDAIKYQNDIYMTKRQIAKLFGCSIDNVELHFRNIFKIGELDKNQVTEDFSVTSPDGKKYNTKHYNRRGIFHIGYRVNSKMGVAFRNWASDVLEEKVTGNTKKSKKLIPTKKDRVKFINELLKTKGITQKDIAKELGLCNVTIHNTIYGKHFNLTVENWLKENLLTEKEQESDYIKKIKEMWINAQNGSEDAYKTLIQMLTSFSVLHNFN